MSLTTADKVPAAPKIPSPQYRTQPHRCGNPAGGGRRPRGANRMNGVITTLASAVRVHIIARFPPRLKLRRNQKADSAS